MPTPDQIIDSLTDQHHRLADRVRALDDDALRQPSGASDWQIHDVLSHLGSGAEITLHSVRAASDGDAGPADNQRIWDRWNALSPRDQAEGFLRHDAELVQAYVALDPAQRQDLRFDLGFLPEPVPLEVAAGLRLNEYTLHAWDVLVGLDPSAVLDGTAADLLLELYAGSLGFMLGFLGRAADLGEPAVVDLSGYALTVQDSVSLTQGRPAAPTASFVGAPEAAVRLVSGRLRPEVTPSEVTVSGNVTLDDLRRIFPGY